jgi:hypothetical protein
MTCKTVPRSNGYRRGHTDESDDAAHLVLMICVPENALQAGGLPNL